jgi:hypothetical protein
LDTHYPPDFRIQVVLDSHSARTSKEMRLLLRGIRVASKAELRERIEQYLKAINARPVPGMESAAR